MRWPILLIAAISASATAAAEKLAIPPDSPRWDLEGNAKVSEFQGRKALALDGAAAVLKDFEMRDGVIDVDMAIAPSLRGFVGFDVRIDKEGANYEEIYLRPHKSNLPDALQYTPVLGTGRNWQLFNGPGFTAAVDIPRNEWFHVRLVVAGAQAKLFIKDMEHPALVMDDLKSGVEKGQIALYDLTGLTYFANFEVQTTADAPWQHHLPPTPAETLTKWSLSPTFDALARDLERAPTAAEAKAMTWQDVEAEPPGVVVVQRYRPAPHPKVTFQNDFATRLAPQPGTSVVYARTQIVSDRDQTRKLYIGYSDEVSVFLNGKILFRGRSAQGFRDPGFLGIVYPEDDAVYLPLKKGKNDLTLALSELGGGWGFICRLTDAGK